MGGGADVDMPDVVAAGPDDEDRACGGYGQGDGATCTACGREDDMLSRLREQARQAMAEFGRLLRVAGEVIVLLVVIALPWIFRAATVAFAAWAISCAYPSLAERLGGDPPAVLLALSVVLLSLAAALGLAQSAGVEPWGAFLAAGAIIYLLGQAARAASPLSAALAVATAFAGVVIYGLYAYRPEAGSESEEETRQEEAEHAQQSSHR